MKIELKNIGTVKHAEIDLDKNLLIFCGPNNTGKTYASYLIYGLNKLNHNKFEKDEKIANYLKEQSFDHEIKYIITRDNIENLISESSKEIIDKLSYIFASNKAFFTNPNLSISVNRNEIEKKINDLIINFQFKIGSSFFSLVKKDDSNLITILKAEKKTEPKDISTDFEFVCDILSRAIKSYLLDLFYKNIFIMPAERSAINIFSKELSPSDDSEIENLLDSKSEMQRYSLPIRDSLEIASDLDNLQKNESKFSFLAELIEKDILNGKIDLSSNGEMQFNPSNTLILGLNIHLSGSIVKSLSSLVFYFRHIAKRGDFIIIDEPELNLHPDNQIIIARILARIVNEGFKVLISTHSDYIITEINNLIRLNSGGENSKSLMEKYGYEKADLINKDVVGVYLFKENHAENIAVDDFGFEIATIQKENSRLAEISESIYFDLFDKED